MKRLLFIFTINVAFPVLHVHLTSNEFTYLMKVLCFRNVKSNSWPLKIIVWSMFGTTCLFASTYISCALYWDYHSESIYVKAEKNSRVHNYLLSKVTTCYGMFAPYDEDQTILMDICKWLMSLRLLLIWLSCFGTLVLLLPNT